MAGLGTEAKVKEKQGSDVGGNRVELRNGAISVEGHEMTGVWGGEHEYTAWPLKVKTGFLVNLAEDGPEVPLRNKQSQTFPFNLRNRRRTEWKEGFVKRVPREETNSRERCPLLLLAH